MVSGAGLILLDWGPTRGDPNPLKARLVNVYTAPEWRRRGLARALTRLALDEAACLGIGTVSLSASAQSLPPYLSLGFEPRLGELRLTLRP